MVSDLRKTFSPKKYYKLAEVKDKIEKVAFDVVRFMDGNDIEGLWKIEKKDDGEYIIATYESDSSQLEKKTASKERKWKVSLSNDENDINIFYDNYPVKKIAAKSLISSETEKLSVAKNLTSNLNTNKNL